MGILDVLFPKPKKPRKVKSTVEKKEVDKKDGK